MDRRRNEKGRRKKAEPLWLLKNDEVGRTDISTRRDAGGRQMKKISEKDESSRLSVFFINISGRRDPAGFALRRHERGITHSRRRSHRLASVRDGP